MTQPRRALTAVLAIALGLLAGLAQPAAAQPDELAAKVVVIGVPGLRWDDVAASPELTALVDQAHVGSMSVKSARSQTCEIDGWLTISAGTRAWGSNTPGCAELPAVEGGRVAGWQSYVDLQREHHTSAELGLLGQNATGSGGGPGGLCGFGPGAAIAVAKADGTVASWRPAFDPAALAGCSDAIVDAGGLPPPREGERPAALKRIATMVQQARAQDAWVLLVGVADDTAFLYDRQLMVAMQLPPDDGPRWLTSGTTRRPGLVRLADVTATVLRGGPPGSNLDGAEIGFTGDRHTDARAVIDDRLDATQRFAHPPSVIVWVLVTLVGCQLLALGWFLRRRTRTARRVAAGTLLVQGGFFAAVFLATATTWWRWPEPGLALYGVVIAISVAVAAASYAVLRCRAAFGVAALAYATLVVDGVLGAPMQVGSMFAEGPVVGGRFYGYGNSTFAVFAVGTLVLAGFAGQRLLTRGRRTAAAAVLGIGGLAIVVEGVPAWGADFGGVIALTPAVLLLAWMTWRGGVSWRALIGIGVTGFVAVGGFALLDYARPPGQRTHFGTFVARVLEGDVGDVFARKLTMSFSLLNTWWGWPSLVIVLLAMAATLWPRRFPSASYRTFVADQPMARPTLLALSLCGVVGALLNDTGITVPAIMFGFTLVLLVAHLLANPVRIPPHEPDPER